MSTASISASPEEVRELIARGRAAQPAWEALGFEGRARVLRRMQKWLVDNSELVVRTIMDETGKTYEDASVAEIAYGAGALGFWAKRAPEYLADEKVRPSKPSASHAGCAARARSTIPGMSSGAVAGTVRTTSPVAGFSTASVPVMP